MLLRRSIGKYTTPMKHDSHHISQHEGHCQYPAGPARRRFALGRPQRGCFMAFLTFKGFGFEV